MARHKPSWGLILLVISGCLCQPQPDSNQDVECSEDATLKCRFSPQLTQKASTLYWIRTNRHGHDNVAIGGTPFEESYSVDHRPEEGIYDLTISGAYYDRDNGQFECRMKEGGSGQQLHSSSIGLTVLLQPSAPEVTLSAAAATEGRAFNLTCASIGGSPSPQISWYREGSFKALEAIELPASDKDTPSLAVLVLNPTKEDDGSKYTCRVWNRAMGNQTNLLEASAQVFVNYFPRVNIGPANPLKIEQDETAQLECTVDSKPLVSNVKWTREGRYIDTHFKHTIPRVTLKDAGSYVCSADNGLGQIGKAELTLDVLHAPIVTLPERKEVKEGTDDTVECKIKANPRPASIQWSKEGDDKFYQNGPVLRLKNVGAEHNGKYTCTATNYLQPTGKAKVLRTGNATIEINIRHQPGKAFIEPEKPIAVDGKPITLTCGANPPGYPAPKFRWWKDSNGDGNTLAVGSEYTIDSVRLTNAGKYYCQPSNEIGEGGVASIQLDVYQAPQTITKLQPKIKKRAGDTGFHITCSAIGKPKPKIKWFKEGVEIVDGDSNMFQISTSEQEAMPNMAYNVLSTLKYVGPERISNSQLMPTDRGHYTCQFENEVGKAETSMLLRIEHSPVVVHQHNKVAFDLGEAAYITCQMQADPAPTFDWTFGNSILPKDRTSYETSMTPLGDDIYEEVLKINRVVESSYGNYICNGKNSLGHKRTIIKLQPKGKPEKPLNVRPIFSYYDAITLAWDEGFNGGSNKTEFLVEYRKQGESAEHFKSCGKFNPCNITDLEQHTQYLVKVRATNVYGQSKYTREIPVATKVDVSLIPTPESVHYALNSKTAQFMASYSVMRLVAKVELENNDGTWSSYDTFVMDDNLVGQVGIEGEVNNLRVRFCLEVNDLLCGKYAKASVVNEIPVLNAGVSEPWLIAVIIFVVVAVIMVVILIVKCCCCRPKTSQGMAQLGKQKKKSKKERPSIGHPTQPPPYASYGIENKGVDTVKDVADDVDAGKNNLYAGYNNDFAANGAPNPVVSYPEQTNSNSNSANGGSVNSQDSLWNVKASEGHFMPQNAAYHAYANAQLQQQQQQHQQQPQQQQVPQQYGANDFATYEPQNLAPQQQQLQTGPGEDYAHYPYPDEYLNDHNQQYLMQEQYGRQQHHQPMEGDYAPYGDVSGLPDPYLHHADPQQQVPPAGLYPPPPPPQQQHQQQFEDSQDEDFASGNGRNRKIIREIIV